MRIQIFEYHFQSQEQASIFDENRENNSWLRKIMLHCCFLVQPKQTHV